MHWSEWAAIILLVVCAIPVLLLLREVLRFTWACALAAWDARKPLVIVETPFGPFTKQGIQWSGNIESGGASLLVMAQDRDGKPDPLFLERLPVLLGQLPQLEQTARQHVSSITGQHALDFISDTHDGGADVALGFNDAQAEDQGGGETVTVDFYDGRVVGSSVWD